MISMINLNNLYETGTKRFSNATSDYNYNYRGNCPNFGSPINRIWDLNFLMNSLTNDGRTATSCYSIATTILNAMLTPYTFGPIQENDFAIGMILDPQIMEPYIGCMYGMDAGTNGRYNRDAKTTDTLGTTTTSSVPLGNTQMFRLNPGLRASPFVSQKPPGQAPGGLLSSSTIRKDYVQIDGCIKQSDLTKNDMKDRQEYNNLVSTSKGWGLAQAGCGRSSAYAACVPGVNPKPCVVGDDICCDETFANPNNNLMLFSSDKAADYYKFDPLVYQDPYTMSTFQNIIAPYSRYAAREWTEASNLGFNFINEQYAQTYWTSADFRFKENEVDLYIPNTYRSNEQDYCNCTVSASDPTPKDPSTCTQFDNFEYQCKPTKDVVDDFKDAIMGFVVIPQKCVHRLNQTAMFRNVFENKPELYAADIAVQNEVIQNEAQKIADASVQQIITGSSDKIASDVSTLNFANAIQDAATMWCFDDYPTPPGPQGVCCCTPELTENIVRKLVFDFNQDRVANGKKKVAGYVLQQPLTTVELDIVKPSKLDIKVLEGTCPP